MFDQQWVLLQKEGDWERYKKALETRLNVVPGAIQWDSEPQSYPCLFFSSPRVHGIDITFVYSDQANTLLSVLANEADEPGSGAASANAVGVATIQSIEESLGADEKLAAGGDDVDEGFALDDDADDADDADDDDDWDDDEFYGETYTLEGAVDDDLLSNMEAEDVAELAKMADAAPPATPTNKFEADEAKRKAIWGNDEPTAELLAKFLALAEVLISHTAATGQELETAVKRWRNTIKEKYGV